MTVGVVITHVICFYLLLEILLMITRRCAFSRNRPIVPAFNCCLL